MIKIKENIINSSYQNAIINLTFGKTFQWLYNESTLGKTADGKRLEDDSFQFIHPMMRKNDNYKSPYADFIAPLIFAIQDSFNFEAKEVLRIKFNMTVNNTKIATLRPHVDTFEDRHVSVIYYVHDCDGETFFYDKLLDTKQQSHYYTGKSSLQNLNIVESVLPKKGTAVMFDSNRLHSASNPVVADRRILLNCVFKV